MMRFVPPVLIATLATLSAVVFARFVPLPQSFAYANAILLGFMTTWLALTVAALLPDRWLFSQYERVQNAFRTLHGLPDTATDSALRLSAQAQTQARRLDAAAPDLKPEVQERVKLTADRLSGIARLIFSDPRTGREYLTLIKRADIVTEAVTKHARLMRNPFAKEADKQTARQSVLAGLDAFSGAYEGMKQKKIETDLADITLSGDLAEQLFDRMKGPVS